MCLSVCLFVSVTVSVCLSVSVTVSVCFCCRQYTSDYKLETYLKVARLYLEDEDPVQAEAYINRAALLQAESTREDLQIHYKAGSTGVCVGGATCVCGCGQLCV